MKSASADWASDIDRAPGDAREDASGRVSAEPQLTRGLRFDERPVGLQLRLGTATSVGEVGAVLEYDVMDWFNVGLGIGTNGSGPMPGAHARVRPFIFRNASCRVVHALVAEAALSAGYYDPGSLSLDLDGGGAEPPQYTPKFVFWWQVEAGWEARWASGLALRASIGFAQCFVNPILHYSSDGRQYTTSGGGPPPRAFVQTLAVGYAF